MCNKRKWGGGYVGGADYVGAASDTLAGYQEAAWNASSVASDSGAIAFQTHSGYDKAMNDNRAAKAAWEKVKGAAHVLPDPNAEQDAKDRIGELDVAYKMLFTEKKTRGKAAWNAGWGGALQAAAAQRGKRAYNAGWGGALHAAADKVRAQRGLPPVATPTSPGGDSPVKKYGLLAAAVAIGTKVLGVW